MLAGMKKEHNRKVGKPRGFLDFYFIFLDHLNKIVYGGVVDDMRVAASLRWGVLTAFF